MRPACHGRNQRRIEATVTVPWKTWARLPNLVATVREFFRAKMVRSTSFLRL